MGEHHGAQFVTTALGGPYDCVRLLAFGIARGQFPIADSAIALIRRQGEGENDSISFQTTHHSYHAAKG